MWWQQEELPTGLNHCKGLATPVLYVKWVASFIELHECQNNEGQKVSMQDYTVHLYWSQKCQNQIQISHL